jgi:hypothetical protein
MCFDCLTIYNQTAISCVFEEMQTLTRSQTGSKHVFTSFLKDFFNFIYISLLWKNTYKSIKKNNLKKALKSRLNHNIK